MTCQGLKKSRGLHRLPEIRRCNESDFPRNFTLFRVFSRTIDYQKLAHHLRLMLRSAYDSAFPFWRKYVS